ncbi:unnamed protein product (macronuclear) [Paramecium tetraurelia]|uniref:Uncharacterized protein n=1 Tax=Paramecium tetraurelia TaxID=5888 RepID=A0E2L7_PARTE|nr:uncharacterized protein GSPATT00022706001 [Paramecium tetraurelia]CAK89534.1 unnamed protein product [Paramecium tetraurelia]|eukprot:XP_001456931.1 hypothetical protein (macronuclear) [Paramecium tetraurelia strain d4-2]
MYNSLVTSKGFYNHRFCSNNQKQKPIKVDFSFEESKPISPSPLIRNIQHRQIWPSANQPKIKLNNFNEKGKQFYMETPKMNDVQRSHSAHGCRPNSSEFRATYSRWVCSPLQQASNTVEPMKGFYTLKYMGEHNQQIGVLSKKLSMIASSKKDNKRRRSYTPSIVINNQYIVNKYLISRKLGEHN